MALRPLRRPGKTKLLGTVGTARLRTGSVGACKKRTETNGVGEGESKEEVNRGVKEEAKNPKKSEREKEKAKDCV